MSRRERVSVRARLPNGTQKTGESIRLKIFEKWKKGEGRRNIKEQRKPTQEH